MEVSTKYDINFFTPHTPFLKDATRLIWIGMIIWFVATYGFHILLRIIEKPTPEAGYVLFQKVEPKLKSGTATQQELVDVANVYLGLVGKSVTLQKNATLKNSFTSAVHELLPDNQKEQLLATTGEIEKNKKADVAYIATALGISGNAAMKAALPYALAPLDLNKKSLTAPELKGIMNKYMVHNQSALTDTIVLGFPFHYLYSALILLTTFVLICLVYCKAIDKVMKKYDLEQTFE